MMNLQHQFLACQKKDEPLVILELVKELSPGGEFLIAEGNAKWIFYPVDV